MTGLNYHLPNKFIKCIIQSLFSVPLFTSDSEKNNFGASLLLNSNVAQRHKDLAILFGINTLE